MLGGAAVFGVDLTPPRVQPERTVAAGLVLPGERLLLAESLFGLVVASVVGALQPEDPGLRARLKIYGRPASMEA